MTTKLDLNSLRADLKREREGDWVSIPDWPGVEFCVRSVHYQPFQDALRALQKRNEGRYGAGKPAPSDEWATDFGTLLAEELLLGWRGVTPDYTPDDALEMLIEEPMRVLRESVFWAAQQVGQAKIEFVKVAAKNSDRSSGGSSKAQATQPGSPS